MQAFCVDQDETWPPVSDKFEYIHIKQSIRKRAYWSERNISSPFKVSYRFLNYYVILRNTQMHDV